MPPDLEVIVMLEDSLTIYCFLKDTLTKVVVNRKPHLACSVVLNPATFLRRR
jgi:hypothetical protein